MKVQNKVIVVTGGGDGMGRQLTLLLLKKGARVAAVDINENSLAKTRELAGDLGKNLSTHVADITNREAMEALPEKIIATHRVVDGVINNAGIIQPFERTSNLPFKDIDRVININLFGVINVTKAFLPYLLQRPEAHILNVSSMGGFLPVPGQSLYGASKAGVKLFTEALHSELMGTHVGVTVAFPGATETNIAQNSGAMIQGGEESAGKGIKMTSAYTAAVQMVEAIEKNTYQLFIGSDSRMMNFLYRLNPKMAARIIYKNMAGILPK
jgi:short-subunit dehydrogenase